jgi:hypothetical protein
MHCAKLCCLSKAKASKAKAGPRYETSCRDQVIEDRFLLGTRDAMIQLEGVYDHYITGRKSAERSFPEAVMRGFIIELNRRSMRVGCVGQNFTIDMPTAAGGIGSPVGASTTWTQAHVNATVRELGLDAAELAEMIQSHAKHRTLPLRCHPWLQPLAGLPASSSVCDSRTQGDVERKVPGKKPVADRRLSPEKVYERIRNAPEESLATRRLLPDIMRRLNETRPPFGWFDLLPPLPPAGPRDSVIINRGLPRTGTSSFAIATALVGMRTLHAGLPRCYPKAMPPWPAVAIANASRIPRWVGLLDCNIGFDAAADVPWFLGDGDELRRAEPWPGLFRFVCTSRDPSAWTESVIHHGSAGGHEMYDFISSLQLTPRGPFPYSHKHAGAARPFLSAFHEWHNRTQCHGRIDLHAPDDAKWAVLCRHVPRRFAARCEAIRRARACWPTANIGQGASKNSSADGSSTDAHDAKCRLWPHGICAFAPSSLPANRTFGGSVTGGWTEIKGRVALDEAVVQCGS